jgi:hypothetical protein
MSCEACSRPGHQIPISQQPVYDDEAGILVAHPTSDTEYSPKSTRTRKRRASKASSSPAVKRGRTTKPVLKALPKNSLVYNTTSTAPTPGPSSVYSASQVGVLYLHQYLRQQERVETPRQQHPRPGFHLCLRLRRLHQYIRQQERVEATGLIPPPFLTRSLRQGTKPDSIRL